MLPTVELPVDSVAALNEPVTSKVPPMVALLITANVLVCVLLFAYTLPARKLPPKSAIPVVYMLPIRPIPPCTRIAPVVVLVLWVSVVTTMS